MRRSTLACVLACVAGVLSPVAGLSGSAQATCNAVDPGRTTTADPAFPASPSDIVRTRRTVEIDGRFITLELTVVRYFGGQPDPTGGLNPVTSVSVDMFVNDGALLPAGLKAAGVRFQRLRGPNPAWFTPLNLTSSETTHGQFELDIKRYQGDLSDRRTVRNVNAAVRLEYQGRVIRVPFGVVPVNQLVLP